MDTPMEGSMPERMMLFVPAVLATLLAVALSAGSGGVVSAADECRSKPGGVAPEGSHWYYRVDRKTHRHCWYLGAAGQAAVVRRAAAPKASPSPKPSATRPSVGPATGDNGVKAVVAGFSVRWPELPKSVVSVERVPAPASNSYSEERATAEAQDEMPLVWPILTAEDVAAAEAAAELPPEPPAGLRLLVAGVAAVLAMAAAMIIRAMFKIATAPVHSRRAAEGSERAAISRAMRPRELTPPAFAGPVAAARLAKLRSSGSKANPETQIPKWLARARG
jgi:hypothetical protein